MVRKKKLLLRNLLKFNEIIQTRRKLSKFKKKKWEILQKKDTYQVTQNHAIFQGNSQRKKLTLKNSLSVYDQIIFYTPTFYNKIYKKMFRSNLKIKQKLIFFFGGMSNLYLKKIVKDVRKENKISQTNKRPSAYLLKKLVSRLDFILYQSGFGSNIRETKTLIKQGHVFVNNKNISNPAFQIKKGDYLNINLNSLKKIKSLVMKVKPSKKTAITPHYLHVNYKTLEIIIVKNLEEINTFDNLECFLDLNNIFTLFK